MSSAEIFTQSVSVNLQPPVPSDEIEVVIRNLANWLFLAGVTYVWRHSATKTIMLTITTSKLYKNIQIKRY